MTKDQQIEQLQNENNELEEKLEQRYKQFNELKDMAYYEVEKRYGHWKEKVWYRDLYNVELGIAGILTDEKRNLTRIIENLINPETLKTNEETNHKAFIH